MAGDWIECRLADACSSIDYGLTASASDRSEGPKFLRITDIVTGQIDWKAVPHVSIGPDAIEKYRLVDGDIVLARTGASTGASAYVKSPPKAVFASYLVRLKAHPSFDSRFLAYYLRSESFWAFMRGVLGDKSAQPNASASTMSKAPLRAPRDKGEQEAIATILGALDDKIELNGRMGETLEEMARALFRAWFVDGAVGLGTSLDDRESVGEYRRPLGELFDVKIGRTPPRKERHHFLPGGCGIPWLSIKSMGCLRVFAWDTEEDLTEEAVDAFRVPVAPAGTVIVSFKLTVGRVAIAGRDMTTNEAIAHLVTRPDTPVGPEYTYLYMSDVDYDALGSTSSIATAVNSKTIRSIEMLVPTDAQHQTFTSVVKPMFERIKLLGREVDTLRQLRDTLLPKLISGELRVPDAERLVSEVA